MVFHVGIDKYPLLIKGSNGNIPYKKEPQTWRFFHCHVCRRVQQFAVNLGKPPNTCEPTLDHAGLTYCFLSDVQSSLCRADFQCFPTKKRLSSGLEWLGAVWSRLNPRGNERN